MVNTLSGSVCAYRKETVKPRFIRIDEVMALLDVTQDEAMDIALAAGARYQLAKIIYSIVGKMRRNGFSQRDVDRQWNQIVNMIRKKQIRGVVVANMAAISSSVADAYFKVGLVIEAGGIVVTVDEGRLDMHIKKGA